MKKLIILTALSLALPLTLPASQLILGRFAQTDAQVLASSVLPATRAESTGYYPLNIAEDDAVEGSRASYHVNYVQLTSPTDGVQSIEVGSKSPQLIYRPMLDQTFRVKPVRP